MKVTRVRKGKKFVNVISGSASELRVLSDSSLVASRNINPSLMVRVDQEQDDTIVVNEDYFKNTHVKKAYPTDHPFHMAQPFLLGHAKRWNLVDFDEKPKKKRPKGHKIKID